MKAIVVGAGIAGLVTARQLGLAGWDVEVLERSAGPRPDGYMMDFFGPGVEASERIGLYPRLAAVRYRVDAAVYVDSHDRPRARLDYRRFTQAAGDDVLSLMRPDLERSAFAALADVPGHRVRVRYGARIAALSADDGGTRLELERAPTANATPETVAGDVLVGADGIHSMVRERLFGPEPDFLRPLGMRAAAYIAREPDLHARFRDRFILSDTIDRIAGMYGIRDDQVAAFLVYRDPRSGSGSDDHEGANGAAANDGARDRLRAQFAGLGSTVDRLIELCPPHPYDDVVAQVVMPSWRRNRAILVGDAAGAVSLLAGQGGSLAVAGGALLGDLLGAVQTPDGIPAALDEFERRFRPVVEKAQASGRRAAETFLPRTRLQRLTRRWIVRASNLPVVNGLVARAIVSRIAK